MVVSQECAGGSRYCENWRMAINNTGVLSGMNGLDNIRACGGYIKPVMHHYDALPFWSIRKAMVGEYNIRI